jgi:hypothetical protein
MILLSELKAVDLKAGVMAEASCSGTATSSTQKTLRTRAVAGVSCCLLLKKLCCFADVRVMHLW